MIDPIFVDDPEAVPLLELLKEPGTCLAWDQTDAPNIYSFILCRITEAGNLRPIKPVFVSGSDIALLRKCGECWCPIDKAKIVLGPFCSTYSLRRNRKLNWALAGRKFTNRHTPWCRDVWDRTG